MIARSSRILSKQQRDEIVQTAHSVRRRRRALGLTQKELDYECGLDIRTVDRIERSFIDHRHILADDSRVALVFDTLKRLESDPTEISKSASAPGRRTMMRRRRIQQGAMPKNGAMLPAKLTLCPDHDCWVMQSGCDAIKKSNGVCRALRSGRGCNGVDSRRALLRKTIEVSYDTTERRYIPCQGDA